MVERENGKPLMATIKEKIDANRQRMYVLILWAIASGNNKLRDLASLFGLVAWSSMLTTYIRPMEKEGLVSRDMLSTGRAVPNSLRLTDKGRRKLSQYAVLNGKKGLEIYEVVARYGETGED